MRAGYVNGADAIKAAQDGDERALCDIISTNLGLVREVCRRFLNRGAEYDDLVQIGTIGMIKAVRKFDPSYGTAFSTYAVPMIIGEIKRFLRDDGIIKIGREVKKNACDIAACAERLRAARGREPTVDEIGKETGLSREDIVFALGASQPVSSIHGSDEDGAPSPEQTLGVDDIEGVCETLALRESLAKLDKNERVLIELRYFRDLTQQQTAKIMGWTQVKVSRYEKKIFAKLRGYMGAAP